MGFLKEGDAERFLGSSDIVDEIVAKVVSDHKMMDELADEMADHLEEVLEEDSKTRDKILAAAAGNEEFRSRLVDKLSAKIG